MPNNTLPIIILAAGSSSRLGRPKQLLPYKNTTLIGHAIETAEATGCENIVVVAGPHFREISAEVNSTKIELIENKDWQSGMASSIHAGINEIKNNGNVREVLIMLCDQPLISSAHLTKLMNSFTLNADKMIATGYEGIAGVPAIFPKELFRELLDLKGDEGARKLIRSRADQVVIVPFENAFLDIDTNAHYQRLMTILTNHNN